MKFLFTIMICIAAVSIQAQFKQQVRGTVIDALLQKPLPGATIVISPVNENAVSDEAGEFRFRDVPVGSYKLTITYSGFHDIVVSNVVVNAGKETVLTIPMDAMIKQEDEVVVEVIGKKNKPLNEMSSVSARAFTVEETQKYAAAVNDPLRMAAAFPGVLASDDGGNSTIIRGNSPTGLLWKMEGMDIPNPNHFSQAGNTGGGISILSSQLLANSDFVTSAFAAEYGNALSGVFDLKLRRGNNERREYSLQAGVLGLNVAAEGPFSKRYNGSFLVNYRYSTLALLNKVGVLDFGKSTTAFQDLSYNIYLPTKRIGIFTLFGFGGLSNQNLAAENDSAKWKERLDRYPFRFVANTGMSGATHTLLVGKKINVKTSVGLSFTKNADNEDYINDDYHLSKNYKDNYTVKKWLFNSTVNYKFSNRLHLRSGIIANLIHFNYYQLSAEHEGDPLAERINTSGNTSTQQAFAEAQLKFSNDVTLNGGLHFLHLSLNNSTSLEPRISLKWNLGSANSVAFGYGLHSQLQIWGVYFAREQDAGGSFTMPNRNLGFTKANHYVLSYSHRLNQDLLIKTEFYYQKLFDVPASTKDSSTFSTLNIIDGYVLEPMVNKGTGKNYGLEISLERYLRNNFYLTLSNSLYESKYTALDGIERDTRFNGNYIITLISGKDFVSSGRKKTFGLNFKTIYAGGLRRTPVDVATSIDKGYAVFDQFRANSLKNPNYFRTDVRMSITWNRAYRTSTLSLDIQNVTNRRNVYNQYFNEDNNRVEYNYQVGIIPVINYKIEF